MSSITMSTRLLQDSLEKQPLRGALIAEPTRASDDPTGGPPAVMAGIDHSRSQLVAKQVAEEGKEISIKEKRNKKADTEPVDAKRVYISEAMRDKIKMDQTADVFQRMGMGKHIRKGDFQDSTQRTPVLIPLHKVYFSYVLFMKSLFSII